MQKSHEEVKPVEIKGSAYSLINKEKLQEMNKGKENSNVSLGKKEIKDPLRKQDDGLIIK